ncbi:MAG: insulinase family protein [Planctomycetes bacterium]|nr:insulinase family protein [Planctomycetota bacterium]MCB9884610.1 insulinase family protein [Planctomycetota bacterium]
MSKMKKSKAKPAGATPPDRMLPDVEVVELGNGFRALLVERGPLPVVASILWYRIGARDERIGETGVSHFLEHMMFKGTDRFPKGHIDLQTSKMGGSNNAFTDSDSTAYYFSLAADRWETALEIEASRMRGCLLDPLEFASEKNVVLEELAMGEDDPWRPLYQATETLMFQVHPYHHPVIGYRQDLERLSAQQMRDYYERNYGPNRAFLVVVGAIDKARTAARIRELFGGMGRVAERTEALREPAPQGERRAELRTPHSVVRLCIGFPTCRMGERDDYALDVIAHDLGNSKNSRLYKRLVLEDELVTDVSVINETRQDPGGFFVMCELRDGADPAEVEAAIREEIAAQRDVGVAKKDLARIRTQIRASFLFQDEAVLDLAMKLARFEAGTPDGYRTLANVLPTYDSLTPKELAEVSAKYLTFDRAAVVWALPAATTAPGVKPRAKVKAAGKGRTRAKAKAQPKAKPKPKPKAKTKRGSKA